MCEPSSNAEASHVDVAHERDAAKEASNPAATVEYWQSALQEFCRNSPQQHAYVANPLATPQAYGLWSGQVPPPLLTPYGPMPFFGGFLPGPYPIPTHAAVPTVSCPGVKPELTNAGAQLVGATEGAKRRTTPATPHIDASEAPTTSETLFSAPPQVHTSILNRQSAEESWIKLDDEGQPPVSTDDRELKKERRKQSNRESARRSRQRKQRECEALQKQVQEMTTRNQRLEEELLDVKQRLALVERENAQLKGNWPNHPSIS